MNRDRILKRNDIQLSALQRSHLPELSRILNNFKISEMLARVPYPYTEADAETFFNYAQTCDETNFIGVITSAENPQLPIGVCSYETLRDGQAELGYWLGEEHWGKGIMSTAARLVVNDFFNGQHASQLKSCFYEINPNSGKILYGLGFEKSHSCETVSVASGRSEPSTHCILTRENWQKQDYAKWL